MSAGKRCGVSDTAKAVQAAASQIKRHITYAVRSSVEQFTLDEFRDLAKDFWNPWQDICDFKATQILDVSKADVSIYSARGVRKDFDGQGGVLAYANLGPILINQSQQFMMVFDLDESWGLNGGTRILHVGRHEAGHIVGLEHSKIKSALMAPYYSVGVPLPVEPDDKSRVISIYGPPVAGPVNPAPVPVPPSNPTGGFMNRETISALVEFVFGYLTKLAAASPSRWDDLLVSVAATQKERIIDALLGLFQQKGSLTLADVEAFLADDAEVQKMLAA